MWLLAILVLRVAANRPGLPIGFDYASTFDPPRQFGSASGIVNVGGLTAPIVLILGTGVVLDLLGGRSLPAFGWVFALRYPLWILGRIYVLRSGRILRRVVR